MPEELKTLPSLAPSTAMISTGACLSDDDLLAFALGELPANMLDRVHLHLDQCDVCQILVAESARAVDAESCVESGRTSWNTVFQPNSLIGKRYRIVRLIGRGGMGEVYEAFDTMLHERVALKTVAATACDSTRAMRELMAEVQLARRITHPNVCRIYDLSTHVVEPSGTEIQFLVMEFVEGECLGKRLRNAGALPLELAQAIAHQLLQGLRAAHQAGILHRDFKSENVMLRSESNGQTTAIILDFGLAKALNDNGRIATTQNHGSGLVGTISYMAPEQIEGEALTCSSDLYAFGVVWFEMLTGRLPFEAASPTAAAMARLHRDAEAPSSYNPKIPKSIDVIVSRCLARQQRLRYADAQDVLDALCYGVSQASARSASGRIRSRQGWMMFASALVLGALFYGATKMRFRAPVAAKAWRNHEFSALGSTVEARQFPSQAWLRAVRAASLELDRSSSKRLPRHTPLLREGRYSKTAPSPFPSSAPTTEEVALPTIAPSAPAGGQRPALLPLWSSRGKSESHAVVD